MLYKHVLTQVINAIIPQNASIHHTLIQVIYIYTHQRTLNAHTNTQRDRSHTETYQSMQTHTTMNTYWHTPRKYTPRPE